MNSEQNISERPEAGPSSPERSSTREPHPPVLTKKQAQRVNSTVVGMFISLGVCLLLLVPVLLLVPQRNNETVVRNVNVAEIAQQAKGGAGFSPLVPRVDSSYRANHAEYRPGNKSSVDLWRVGYVTPQTQYLEFTQTQKSNPTWLAQTLAGPEVSQRTVGKLKWKVYASADGRTSWVSSSGRNVFLLQGKAEEKSFEALAEAILASSSSSPTQPSGA